MALALAAFYVPSHLGRARRRLGKLKDAVASLARVDALLSAEEAPQFAGQTRKKSRGVIVSHRFGIPAVVPGFLLIIIAAIT
mgnify:CR=1 FL=1